MAMYNVPAEESLVRAAELLKDVRMRVYAIHFHLSGLKPENRIMDSSYIVSLIKEDTENIEVGIYFCHDGDVFVILKTPNKELIQKKISSLRFFYADDPLACNAEEDSDGFATIYDVVEHYEDFFFVCNRKLMVYKENKGRKKNGMTEEEDRQARMSAWKRAIQIRATRHKLCILIVEDQPFSRQLLKEPLAKHHEALAAKDAMEGLDLYVANAPDIVFLDIELPDLNGYQVLQRILKLDPTAFVVMTTANNIASDVKKAIAEGARGYIVKPFTRQRVEQYIELYKTKFRQG